MIAFEYLIILGLVGFYLYDSAKLCFYNEFFILKGFSAKFKLQLQNNRLSILKKFLMIPSPFSPQYLCFIVRWQLTQTDQHNEVIQQEINHILHIQKILKPLQALIFLNALLMLILFPMALLSQWNYLYMAILIVLIYSINIISIGCVFLQRKNLCLSNLKFSHLVVDALLCPPFALNMLQKISLASDFKTDGIILAQHLLQAEDFQALISQTIADIEILKNNHNTGPILLQQLDLKQNYLHRLGLDSQ